MTECFRMNGKDTVAEDWQQHVVGAEQPASRFDEYGGAQTAIAANIAETFEYRSEGQQVGGAQ